MSKKELTPEQLKELLEFYEKIGNEKLKSLEYDLEQAKLAGESMEVAKARLALLKQLQKETSVSAERLSKMSEAEKKAFKDKQDRLASLKKELKEYGDTVDKITKKLEDQTDLMRQKGAEAGQKFFGGIASRLGMASRSADSWIGRLRIMGKNMGDPKFAEEFTKKFREIFTLENMVSGASMAVVEASIAMAMQADKVTAAFAKQTGTGTTHRAEIVKLGQEYRELGVTQEDAAKAIGSLFDKMPGYTDMAGNQRREFERLTVTLEKLGVATDDSAALMSDLMKGQKMSADMAMKQTQDLAMMAESLQTRAGEFVKGFREAQKTLAPYGRQAITVFKNIASAAKAAGVETADLLGLAGQFDTFSDAANTAGKLNAILGGQLSATDLLMKKEDERIETVIRSMQAQGMAFKDMDRFTQKAIAQTLGIQDLNKAQKILGMDLQGFKNYQAKAAAAAKEQAEMEEKAKAAMDSMQKLKMAFANLATGLLPLIEGFQMFAQLVLDVSETMGGPEVLAYVFGIAALVQVLGPLMAIFKFFGIGFKFFAAGSATAGAAAGAAAAPMGALAGAMAGVSLSMLGMALAIGIVMILFIILISTLVDAGVHGMHAGVALLLVAASVFVLSKALAVLGTIGVIGGTVLAGLVLTFVAMALATAEAGEGTAKAFKEMTKFVEAGGKISKISKTLEDLGTAFKNLNVAMKGSGIIQKGLAFIGLGGAPKKNAIARMVEDMQPLLDKADQLASIFDGITNVFKLAENDVGATFTKMAVGLEEIFKTVDKSTEKGVQVTHTLENLALITTGTSANTAGVGGVIKALKTMNKDMKISLQLDSKAVKDLMAGNAVEVMARI